jgi:hypothetical protein
MGLKPDDIRLLAQELAREFAQQLTHTIQKLDQEATDAPVTFTVKQTAEIADVTEETLCRWRLAGKGPAFIREGKFIRYPKDALFAWLKGERS